MNAVNPPAQEMRVSSNSQVGDGESPLQTAPARPETVPLLQAAVEDTGDYDDDDFDDEFDDDFEEEWEDDLDEDDEFADVDDDEDADVFLGEEE